MEDTVVRYDFLPTRVLVDHFDKLYGILVAYTNF